MKQKQLLILGALGLGAYLLLKKKGSSSSSSGTGENIVPPAAFDNNTLDLGGPSNTSLNIPDGKIKLEVPKVGIFGCSMGSVYTNIDTVTSMYGIGSVPKKNITYKGYNIRVLYPSGYFETYLPNYTKFVQADTLKGIKEWIKKDIKLEEDRYGSIGSIYKYNHPKGLTHCQDGTYSDATKGACGYHGGAHEIKLRKGMRDYTGKGDYAHYASYRKAYKNSWAKQNRASKSDRVVTL